MVLLRRNSRYVFSRSKQSLTIDCPADGDDAQTMLRIVVMGQPGMFGRLWCRRAAVRLAKRLKLPCIDADQAHAGSAAAAGWVTVAAIGEFPSSVLRAADTAIWLRFSPLAVAHAWVRGVRDRLRRRARRGTPALADIGESLLHMAFTPHVHGLLNQPTLSHLQVFLLRNPDETDFWLRLHEQHSSGPPTVAQPT